MKKVLKINGEPVINFQDLKQRFSPFDIYQQLDVFLSFARFHCTPLQLQYEDGDTGIKMPYKFLSKSFWYRILSEKLSDNKEHPNNTFVQPLKRKECSYDLVTELLREKIREQENLIRDEELEAYRESYEWEIQQREISKKLLYLDDIFPDPEMVVAFLAISELCETDPCDISKEIWIGEQSSGKEEKSSVFVEVQNEERVLMSPVSDESNSFLEIRRFDYMKEVSFPIGYYPLRFWYHENFLLEEGETIQTVRICAEKSSNRYARLQIELYSPKDNTMKQKIELKPGEWRYCNVSGGKIIKFLPGVCISDDYCMMRKSYHSAEVMVQSRLKDTFILDIPDISSFAAGDSEQGYLFIQNGQVNPMFYDVSERYSYAVIKEKAVEVAIDKQGYHILLENGEVINDKLKVEARNRICLSPIGRTLFYQMSQENECREVAVSADEDSAAILKDHFDSENIIFYDDARRTVAVYERDDYVEVILEETGISK